MTPTQKRGSPGKGFLFFHRGPTSPCFQVHLQLKSGNRQSVGRIMYEYQALKVTQEGKGVTAFLHRPDAHNAIDMRMVNDLRDLVDKMEDAADVAVLVLRGSPDVFSSGMDLGDFISRKQRNVYGGP